MESGSFNFVIHDPPARALSRTDVYGLEFYSQLRRVLTNDGSLFHYIGRKLQRSRILFDIA
jgi:predicted methyltransferase